MVFNKKIVRIINRKLKNSSWALMKVMRTKPSGYKGYMFTQYDFDDMTIVVDLKAKTPQGLAKKIIKTYDTTTRMPKNHKKI